MDKETRAAIERATQRARKLLEADLAEQLEGTYDVLLSGKTPPKPGERLQGRQRALREKVVAAIEHKVSAGMTRAQATADYLRDAAFTILNRFAALKLLEARELVQECVSKGEESNGYRELCGLAPGLALLPGGAGYRLYLECLFDELSTEVKVLFDRRDPASALWPRRQCLTDLLALLNAPELTAVWAEDETIGWIYQYFNSPEERRAMRGESQAPRNSRELAVRNQFFTPRYVVEFLTDNTLGRIWYEMQSGRTRLVDRCEYLVRRPDETYAPRPKKDPRDLRVLDPACGSGHFLLYAFDLVLAIYEEAWDDPEAAPSERTGRTLRQDHPDREALKAALPGLILRHNLHGVDIDPRCAQIAQLALWLRAQRAFRDLGVPRAERPRIRRANVVVAEPIPAPAELRRELVDRLGDERLAVLFDQLVEQMQLAGELGLLLRIEELVRPTAGKQGETGDLFTGAGERLRVALQALADDPGVAQRTARRLFAEDALAGLGLLELAEKKYDVVLMNPPFGAGSTAAKKRFESAYPRTKNDVYAAFVERGVELLRRRSRLGAITSRTGFFLTSFQMWREEILLKQAPPAVFADLGHGVLDGAMVEAAAYCLEMSK